MTGVILAGGRATRFSGRAKAFIEVDGKAIIETQMELFNKLFDDVIIVTNDTVPYLRYNAVLVNDIVDDKGPLSGIYTALEYMKGDSCFIAACDMPFLNEELIRYMIDNAGKNWIHTVKIGDRYEPLHTVYKKQCLKTVKRMVKNEELKISPLFIELKAKTVPEEVLERIDPEFKSFKNINTEEDLQEVT